jgi:hypothetical protein
VLQPRTHPKHDRFQMSVDRLFGDKRVSDRSMRKGEGFCREALLCLNNPVLYAPRLG